MGHVPGWPGGGLHFGEAARPLPLNSSGCVSSPEGLFFYDPAAFSHCSVFLTTAGCPGNPPPRGARVRPTSSLRGSGALSPSLHPPPAASWRDLRARPPNPRQRAPLPCGDPSRALSPAARGSWAGTRSQRGPETWPSQPFLTNIHKVPRSVVRSGPRKQHPERSRAAASPARTPSASPRGHPVPPRPKGQPFS